MRPGLTPTSRAGWTDGGGLGTSYLVPFFCEGAMKVLESLIGYIVGDPDRIVFLVVAILFVAWVSLD